MKKTFLFFILLVNSMVLFSNGGEINVSIGFSYLNGYYKFISEYEDTLSNDYHYTESYYLPIGFIFSINLLSEKGFGLDINFGPMTYSYLRIAEYIGGETKIVRCYDIPISLSLKYLMFPKGKKSPYFFIGRMKHYARASGKDIWDKEGFLYGGLGIRFLKNKIKGISLELSYDNSEVYLFNHYDYDFKTLKPYAFMLGILFTF